MNYKGNIKKYYYYSAFAELLILGPIIILFFLAKGLSFTQITILQSISAISVFIFEVPTGVVADRMGRKFSMVLGAALWALSLFTYIVGKTFIIFALAEIIFSLGAAFKSGADSALIYDSLKNLGREDDFQYIEGRARSFILYTQAFGSIIAGFVYEVNIYLPMIISIGFMIVTILIALTFDEPEVVDKEEFNFRNYYKQIKDSAKFTLNHEKIKAILLFSMVFYIFYRGGFLYFQPYMEAVNIPVRYFGVIFFVFNIVAAVTSRNCHWIMNKTKPRTLLFMALLMIVSFGLLGLIKIWPGVLAILLQQVARGLYRPVTRKYLNKHIPSKKRATILSFQSLVTSIAVAVTYPLMGILKDSTNIFTSHLVIMIAMSILMFIVNKYMNQRLGKGHEVNFFARLRRNKEKV